MRQYAEDAEVIDPGEEIPVGKHMNLRLDSPGRKSFFFDVAAPGRFGLFTQHLPEEFDLQLRNADGETFKLGGNFCSEPACEETETGTHRIKGAAVHAEAERTWVAQHEHDDEVGSISIEIDGDADPEKLNAWLGQLLRERGVDIFRMKGFISVAGESRRFVFQGVHMLFDGQPDREWGDAPRRNQLVFIGRNLDGQSMREGFEACLI